jgi:hypothetical protein
MSVPDFDELLVAEGARSMDYPSDKFESWLESRGFIGNEAYLAGCMFPKRTVSAYPYDFLTESKVIAMNSDKAGIPRPLDVGLLIIASGPNGDLLAVDLRDEKSYAVGIIDHERVWDDVPVRDIFAPFAAKIEGLALLMHRVKAPGDYREARAARRGRQRKGPASGEADLA